MKCSAHRAQREYVVRPMSEGRARRGPGLADAARSSVEAATGTGRQGLCVDRQEESSALEGIDGLYSPAAMKLYVEALVRVRGRSNAGIVPQRSTAALPDPSTDRRKLMRDWTAVPYEPLSGFDVAVVSPAGVVHRFDSLAPNCGVQCVDLIPGAWTVHNDSPYLLRVQADSEKSHYPINTLRPSEKCCFDWSREGHELTATLCASAQVMHRPSMDTDIYMRRAEALELTKWEYLFYQYMVAAGTGCSRIPEGASKTPDFTVLCGDRIVPVELKEFAPNPIEKRNEELRRARGYDDGHGGEVGHRIIKAAQSARSQLRSFIGQHGDGPTILAVMDTSALGHADPLHLAALF